MRTSATMEWFKKVHKYEIHCIDFTSDNPFLGIYKPEIDCGVKLSDAQFEALRGLTKDDLKNLICENVLIIDAKCRRGILKQQVKLGKEALCSLESRI